MCFDEHLNCKSDPKLGMKVDAGLTSDELKYQVSITTKHNVKTYCFVQFNKGKCKNITISQYSFETDIGILSVEQVS